MCGAAPDDQHATHGSEEIEAAREAAVAEIKKINILRGDLKKTLDELLAEAAEVRQKLVVEREHADAIEAEIRRLSPDIRSQQRSLSALIERRE